MELPSQSGLRSPKYTDSEDDESMNRAQIRKNNKPLLEKKRRARINSSLEQLKSLVLDALKKDSARHSKLEKADILEMTVKHLRELQRQQMAAAMTVDPSVVTKYQSGFGECAQEVQRYLGSIDGLSSEVRIRLMQHLNNCMNQVHQISSFGALPVYSSVPCASPTQSLPGISLRPLLPFGGLALTSSSSPSSLYGSGDYPRCESALSLSSPSCRVVSSNPELVQPLSEKSVNLDHVSALNRKSPPRCGDDNNNNVCAPPTKRQKLDTRKQISENNRNYENQNNEQNLYDIKSEPVWRPW